MNFIIFVIILCLWQNTRMAETVRGRTKLMNFSFGWEICRSKIIFGEETKRKLERDLAFIYVRRSYIYFGKSNDLIFELIFRT